MVACQSWRVEAVKASAQLQLNMDFFGEGKLKIKISDGVLTITTPSLSRLKQAPNENESGDQVGTDVILQFGSEQNKLSMSKALLRERVPYFHGMFSNCFQESRESVINLGDTIDFDSASKVLRFISKGAMKVSGEDFQGVFVLADLWGLEALKNACVSFMVSQVDSVNCLDLLELGRLHSCDLLIQACDLLICQEFQLINKTPSFLQLSSDTLISILQMEGLNTGFEGEDTVMKSVRRWYDHDPAHRDASLKDVLTFVDVCCVGKDVLSSMTADFTFNITKEIQSRVSSGDVDLRKRCYRQRFLVCCGFSQSRTGPTCPLANSTELFDPDSGTFSRVRFPDAPPFGIVFNVFGRVVFFAAYMQDSQKSTGKKILSSHIFTFQDNAKGGKWRSTPDLFSLRARDCLSDSLINGGCVVHCPEKNCLYSLHVRRSVCLEISCTDGSIFCDFKADLPKLSPHLDESHAGLQGVCHKGRLFVLGGFSGPELERSFSDIVLVLSQDSLKWEHRKHMIIPRTGFAVTSYRDKLVVSGGYGGTIHRRRHQSCEAYDFDQDQWQAFAPMQQSRSGHCMIVANDLLYVIGGKSYASQKLPGNDSTSEIRWHPGGARIVSNYVETYQESASTWLRTARMHNARCNFQTVVL